jgi:hypothetical protein
MLCRGCALALSLLVCVPAQAQAVGASAGPDSLGLDALNRTFEFLPNGAYGTRLTMRSLAKLAPSVKQVVIGPTGTAFERTGRDDGIRLQFGFDWIVGEESGDGRTDDPPVSSLYFDWAGTDVHQFLSVFERFRAAMHLAASPPICVDYGTNISTPQRTRRSREAAWIAGGWLGHVIMRATADSAATTYILQYQASRLPGSGFYAPAAPHKIAWDCLPAPSELLPIKR